MDKRQKREQRKREEQRQQRKQQHVDNHNAKRAIRPSEIVPLNIDGSVNLYDEMKKALQGDSSALSETLRNAIAFQGMPLDRYIANVDKTLGHFKVTLDKWSDTGNVLIRFGLLYSSQPDGKVFQINSDDVVLNWIADLWEYFNKLSDNL